MRSNISSFRMLEWQHYFDNTKNGAILVDITSRALHFWSEDQTVYKLYPTSVPLSEDLTRRGRTEVIQKVVNPAWRPTPAMKRAQPRMARLRRRRRARRTRWAPARSTCPGPTYRIHGTHDTRKIGRRSSNGCIGLYNEHIAELFALAKVGTQVLLI